MRVDTLKKKLKEYEYGVVDYIYSFRLATAGGNEIMLLQVPLQNPEPAHPCPKVAPHIRINAGTMEASASISDACSTMDIFKAAICALMLSKEYEQGGFTFGRTRQSTAVPPSCSTSGHIGR